jgi:thiol-disulfide isomerase/thioredoxin
VGGEAPELDAVTWLSSGRLRLRQLRDRVVVLVFWATWCPPCRKAIPHLNALHSRYKVDRVVFIGLTEEPAAKVKSFVAANDIRYPVGAGSASVRLYGIRRIPRAFVVAPGGRIAWEGHPTAGPAGADGPGLSDLERRIKGALSPAPPGTRAPQAGKPAEARDVYVLKDGRRLEATSAIDLGEEFCIRDEKGAVHIVKKSEIEEVVEATPRASDKPAKTPARKKPRASDEPEGKRPGPSVPRYKLLVRNAMEEWVNVRIKGPGVLEKITVPEGRTVPTILPKGTYEITYGLRRGPERTGEVDLTRHVIIVLRPEKK